MRMKFSAAAMLTATLMLVSLLVGCATIPVPTAQAPSVPASRVLSPAFLQHRPGYGQVIVKRDEGFSASACNTRIFANGVPVADISTGEKVVFYLPPGDQMIAAMSAGICIGGLIEARAAVSAERAAIYRVGYGSSGEFQLQPTAF